MSYNQKQKLQQNIAAIKIALKWKEKDPLFGWEIEELSLYSGFGGIKCVLFGSGTKEEWKSAGASESDMKLYEDVQELFEFLKKELGEGEFKKVFDSMKASCLTAFFTPPVIPETFFKVLKDYTKIETIYEPSAGAGVFISEAIIKFPDLKSCTVVEKDKLTAKVLKCYTSTLPVPAKVHSMGFEETPNKEDGTYDLITSNIPFGAFPIYDPKFKSKNLTGKIHNYFFAKGLDKLKDSGILAYLVTNAFLDSPSNKSARKYLFSNSDFISLSVLPDNLMKDSANTEAGSHFLVVRKRAGKKEEEMSEDELRLCESTLVQISGVTVAVNKYVQRYGYCRIGKQKLGKNQYGKAAIETLWDKSVEEIGEPFERVLRKDFEKRYLKESKGIWNQIRDNERTVVMDVKSPIQFLAEETIPNSEEVAPWEDEDPGEASTCCGCGVGMFGNEPFCFMCKEEGRTLSPIEDEDDEMNKAFLNEDTTPAMNELFSKASEEAIESSGLSDIFKTREEWENYFMHGVGIPDTDIVKGIELSEEQKAGVQAELNRIIGKRQIPEHLNKVPLRIEDCSITPIPGTIIEIKTGKEDLFEDKTELVQVTAMNEDGSIEHVPAPCKEGRESEIMKSYMQVRDAYLKLEAEENKGK